MYKSKGGFLCQNLSVLEDMSVLLENMSVHGGYSVGDYKGTFAYGANAGFEFGGNFDDKIYGSLGLDYSSLHLNNNGKSDDLMTTYLSMGYKFTPKFNTYLLVGSSSGIYDSGTAFGTGVKYQIMKYVALDAHYMHVFYPHNAVDVVTFDIELYPIFLHKSSQFDGSISHP